MLVASGFQVDLVDTPELFCPDTRGPHDLADAWSRRPAFAEPVDVVVGNALGGVVALAMLGRLPPETPVVLLSAPTHSDARLVSALLRVADLARAHGPSAACERLSALVTPAVTLDGEDPGARGAPDHRRVWPSDTAAVRRFQALHLFAGLDLRAEAAAHTGPMLAVVGERSRLVGAANVDLGPGRSPQVVPGAGMRAHLDHADEVTAGVRRFLQENGVLG